MGELAFDTRVGSESMEAVCASSTRVEGARLDRLEALARLDACQGWAYDGFTSTSAFLAARCGMGFGQANREVFLARSLEHLPYATKLARTGRITVSQLEFLAHARHRHPDAYATDEATLAEAVSGLTLSDTRRAVDYWCQAHDEPGESESVEPSRVHLSKTWQGRGRLDGDLEPEAHDLVAAALDSLISEIVRGTPADELRPMSEMRAEALAEMARRFLDAPDTPTDHGNRPHLTAVIDWEVLSGQRRHGTSELGDGTILSPEAIQRLACDAVVCRLITGPAGEILDMGRSRRTVTPAQWRALRVRDRHCQFPHCRRPWSWCDAHHIIAWTLGGPTDLDHLILICRFHHTLVHEGGWSIQGEIGSLRFVRPDGSILPKAPP